MLRLARQLLLVKAMVFVFDMRIEQGLQIRLNVFIQPFWMRLEYLVAR